MGVRLFSYRPAGSSRLFGSCFATMTIRHVVVSHTPAYPVQIDAVRDREFKYPTIPVRTNESTDVLLTAGQDLHEECFGACYVHAIKFYIIHRMLSVVATSNYWFMSFDIISSAAAGL